MRKHANKRHPTVEINRLIDFVNSVPPEFDLPPLTATNGKDLLKWIKTEEKFDRFRQSIGGMKADTFLPKLFSNFNVGWGTEVRPWRAIKPTGVKQRREYAKEHRSQVPRPPKTYNRVLQQYLRLRYGRELLRWITTTRYVPGSRVRWLMPAMQIQSAETDGEGKLHFVLIFPELEGVEVHRINLCPLCHKIFWSSRSDQPACSNVCTRRMRNRRWRERYFERYKFLRDSK